MLSIFGLAVTYFMGQLPAQPSPLLNSVPEPLAAPWVAPSEQQQALASLAEPSASAVAVDYVLGRTP
jgi:hypothetical protein